MELNQLMPGSPIELSIIPPESEEEEPGKALDTDAKAYLSSLFDISKSGELIIHFPTEKGKYQLLPMDCLYRVIIKTNVGLFYLEGMIINKGKIEKFPVYILKPMGPVKKVQRRDYFRFECTIPVIVHPISREIGLLPTKELIDKAIATEFDDVSDDVSATILDISGGGARFNAVVDINTDSYMLLSFSLFTNGHELPMQVVCRRVKSSFKEELSIFEHRVEFLFKENDEREVIIKYIFDEQRRLMKKNQG